MDSFSVTGHSVIATNRSLDGLFWIRVESLCVKLVYLTQEMAVKKFCLSPH